MDSQSPLSPEQQPSSEVQTVPLPIASKPELIAPVWHTVALIALILFASFSGPGNLPGGNSVHSRIPLYAATAVMELIFVLFIWFGIRRKGVKMRQLIGGRWISPEDFLVDMGIGIGFWVASALVIAVLKVALGLVDLHNPDASLQQMKQAVAPIIPRSGLELGVFLALTLVAGFFEEIIFRGYLMKQMGALCKNMYVGVFVSGILFGAAHGYQGVRLMGVIAVLGILLGLLAVWRKSLRPGMIAHAWTDAASGIALYFFS